MAAAIEASSAVGSFAAEAPAAVELALLHEHAERIRNDEHQIVATMSEGDAWAQGDVLLVQLRGIPAAAERLASTPRQLAPGSTQGSRHCLASTVGIDAYQEPGATPLDGPILVAPRGLRVNHPEHGDVTLPAGVYAVVYQRAYGLPEPAEQKRRKARQRLERQELRRALD